MPQAALLGHTHTGAGEHGPSPAVGGSPNVFIGGRRMLRQGDGFADGSTVTGGAPHVRINGQKAARQGDAVSNGATVQEGCPRVRIGNCGGEEFGREAIFASLTDPNDKLILCMPEIEAAEAEQCLLPHDRQGWIHAHECLLKWMRHKAYTSKGDMDIGGQEPYLVEWAWLVQYGRVQRALNALIEPGNLFHPDALANLTRFLEKEFAFSGAGMPFDHVTLSLAKLREHAFQSQPLRYELPEATLVDGGRLVPDGLQAAIAQTRLFTVAAGLTKVTGSIKTVIVKRIGVFIHDGFDFNGDQWLGNWRCDEETKEFSIFYGVPVYNSYFRGFRARTGYGCDFRILCVPHVAWEGEYMYDAP